MSFYITNPGETIIDVTRNTFDSVDTADFYKNMDLIVKANPNHSGPYFRPYFAVYIPDEQSKFDKPENVQSILNMLNFRDPKENMRLKYVVDSGIDPFLLAELNEAKEIIETKMRMDNDDKMVELLKTAALKFAKELPGSASEAVVKRLDNVMEAYHKLTANIKKDWRGQKVSNQHFINSKASYDALGEQLEKVSLLNNNQQLNEKFKPLRNAVKNCRQRIKTFNISNYIDMKRITASIRKFTILGRGFLALAIFLDAKEVYDAYQKGEDWQRELVKKASGITAGLVVGGAIIASIAGAPVILFVVGVVSASAVGAVMDWLYEQIADLLYDKIKALDLYDRKFDPLWAPIPVFPF